MFSFWCHREQGTDQLYTPHVVCSCQDNLYFRAPSPGRGEGIGLDSGTAFAEREIRACCSRVGAGEAVVWVYLAPGSHDTLGNKHSHFLSGRLLWINKQDCRAALVWKSRDKPLLLSGWLLLISARPIIMGRGQGEGRVQGGL